MGRAFHGVRRLEFKTQVLVNFEGDHFRTRLTHTLDGPDRAHVSRALGLDEDLPRRWRSPTTSATAVRHAGEWALDAALRPFGGLTTMSDLPGRDPAEQRYALFDGLNLRSRRGGLVKHNGPLPSPRRRLPSTAGRGHAARPAAAAERRSRRSPIRRYCNHDMATGLRRASSRGRAARLRS
jgi:dGTPase